MSRNTTGAPSAQSGPDDASERRPAVQGARGILRRLRGNAVPAGLRGLTCPDCGLLIRDPVSARLGYCDRCRAFTCMCGAGRKIICPDMMTMTTWHTPCTQLGAVAWEITQDGGSCITLLCGAHDAQVRSGETPWITDAVPLGTMADS